MNLTPTDSKRGDNFTSKGPNWVHWLDGHDKLMGYQNSTFPPAIYGCLDTASRKLLWLKVWVSNCDPNIIGRWYLEHLWNTGDRSHAKSWQRYRERSYDHYACIPKETSWRHGSNWDCSVWSFYIKSSKIPITKALQLFTDTLIDTLPVLCSKIG